ncbi:MAG TPA: hypothetical protein VK824_05050 [Planctomycetota bacterium]|nr:hypothetical protein [Planctomycetota bacterium]
MDTTAAGHAPLSRSLLPVLAALVLVALIFLLPRRAAETAVAADPLEVAPLALDQVPDWARQRGDDAVMRALDRLAWAGHDALEAGRYTLEAARGTLAPELLRRLDAVGESDPVLASKLVAVLGPEDESAPGVVDELVKRARSVHPLPVKAALRELAHVRARQALDGILPRLEDADLEVRANARAALSAHAIAGDVDAQTIVLAELITQPAEPDLAYLSTLKDFPDPAVTLPALRAIANKATSGARLVALTTLLRQEDPQARAVFEAMIAGSDPDTRINAWQALGVAHKVGGQSRWRELLGIVARGEQLHMAQVMLVAVETDHPDKGLALDLLVGLAADRTNSVHDDILTALYLHGHPWAQETTREEIRTLVGGPLALSVDRVIQAGQPQPDILEIALARLQDGSLRDDERLLLCRLLAHVDPARGAEPLVSFALDVIGRDAGLANEVIVLLPALGVHGLQRLERELGTAPGRELFLRDAADSRLGAALPGIERIALDAMLPERERFFALDCLARIHDGPREEVLRRVIDGWPDPRVKARAQLIFWNYL